MDTLRDKEILEKKIKEIKIFKKSKFKKRICPDIDLKRTIKF